MKILNLYAGIGGNRKHWDGEKHEITAVEIDQDIAQVYRDHFPQDQVVEKDAHEYLRENHEDFDFIWSSPPCPTHSKIRNIAGVGNQQVDPVYPDMKLYQEIIFLRNVRASNGTDFEGDFVVENVESYYQPLIQPQKMHRHYFWANFAVPQIDLETDDIQGGRNREQQFGFDLSHYGFKGKKKGKMLRNAVNPKLGQVILENRSTKQQKLARVEQE